MLRDALAYATAVDPAYPTRIQGASETEIKALEKLCGRPLPAPYRGFLSLMGKKSGGLDFLADGSTDIDAVTRFYIEDAPTGEAEIPEDALVIGRNENSGILLLLKPIDAEEPEVWGATFAGPLGIYAGSLANMVSQTAFYRHRIGSYPQRVTLYQPGKIPSIMEKAKAIVSEAGYSPLPFSDAANGCFETEAASVQISDLAYLRRYVTIGFRDEKDVTPLIDKLSGEFQFKIMRH
jgi:SMI1/KNR4 family protein SUKH-1